MRILVIEDEKKTATFLAKGLREAGFDVEVARDRESGFDLARGSKFGLLIVDIMIPKRDGWTVKELREAGVQMPVIFDRPRQCRRQHPSRGQDPRHARGIARARRPQNGVIRGIRGFPFLLPSFPPALGSWKLGTGRVHPFGGLSEFPRFIPSRFFKQKITKKTKS